MKTEVIETTFKGQKILSIHEVKSVNGRELLTEKPIISFGVKKATAILSNMDKLREYVAQNPFEG